MNICQLEALTIKLSHSNEGTVDWYDLKKIEFMEKEIIPSDFAMIKHLILKKTKTYYDCVLEKVGHKYLLRKFE